MNIKSWFKNFGWLILDLGMGGLWTLAFPPFNWLPFFWLGGLYLLNRVSKAPSIKQAAWRGWVWGVGMLWAAYYWLTPSLQAFGGLPLPAGIAINQLHVSVLGIEYALVGVGVFLISKHLSHSLAKLVATAVLLAAFDVFFPQLLPWDAALILSSLPFWQQTADIWGAAGLAFGLYLSVSWLWLLSSHRRQVINAIMSSKPAELVAPPASLGSHWLLAAPVIGMVMLAGIYGWYGQQRWQDSQEGQTVRIGGVQASISNQDKSAAIRDYDEDTQQRIFDTHLNMSEQAVAEGAELVIWPETAFPGYINPPSAQLTELGELAQGLRADFLFGGFDWVPAGEGQNRYNGLFYLDSLSGQITQHYYKSSLVLGTEYTPLYNRIAKLREIYPRAPNLSAGPSPAVIDWRGIKLGTTICYEGILPGLMQKLANQRPQILVNATNDSYFGNSRGPIFHMSTQRLRSVEYRLPIFRITNNGISGVVTPYGQLSHQLNTDEVDNLVANINIREFQPTFYQRFGYWLTRISLLGGTAWLVYVLWKKHRVAKIVTVNLNNEGGPDGSGSREY